MADTPLDTTPQQLPYFFFGNSPGINQQLRQRIALQMMQQKRAFPKNVGEGIAAVGDAIGDTLMTRGLLQGDADQQAQARRDLGGGPSPYATDSGGGVAPVTAATPPPAAAAAPADDNAVATGFTPPAQAAPSATPLLAGTERDRVVRTLVNEAGNQGPEGLRAAAAVIRNRVLKGGYGGATAGEVVAAPHQFEGYARNASVDPNSPAYAAAGKALDEAYGGNDPTGGAVNFINPALQAKLGRAQPSWAPEGQGQRIGDHVFYGGNPQRAAIARAVVAQNNAPNAIVSDVAQNAPPAPPVPPVAAPPSPADFAAQARQMAGAGAPPPGGGPPDLVRQAQPPGDFSSQARQMAVAGSAPPDGDLVAQAQQAPQAPPQAPQAPPQAPPDLVAQAQQAPQQQITPMPQQQQQITPMPQPQQAQAPQATPGYVPPDIGDATRAPLTVPHAREIQLRNLIANTNNPYTKASAEAELGQWETVRKSKDATSEEAYKKQLDYVNSYRMERQKLLADQQKRIDEANKARRELEEPTVKTINNEEVQFDRKTGTWITPPQGGVDPNAPPQTNFKGVEQAKSYRFGEMMRDSMRGIADNGSVLTDGRQAAKAMLPAGNYLVSPEYGRAADYAKRWVMAKLRDESGATIGTAEYNREMANYFPVPGDSPQRIRDKAAARQVAFDGMISSSGQSGRKSFEWDENKYQNPTVVHSREEAEKLPKGTYGTLNGRRFKVE